MTTLVVDASAVAAFLFEEDEGPAMLRAFGGLHLVAPSLLDHELASVCVKKCRREPERAALFRQSYGLRGVLGIETLPIDHDGVLATALAAGLSAYDATYLWLAQANGFTLLTLDRKLERMAKRDGL